jgi:hypothetical protein
MPSPYPYLVLAGASICRHLRDIPIRHRDLAVDNALRSHRKSLDLSTREGLARCNPTLGVRMNPEFHV